MRATGGGRWTDRLLCLAATRASEQGGAMMVLRGIVAAAAGVGGGWSVGAGAVGERRRAPVSSTPH